MKAAFPLRHLSVSLVVAVLLLLAVSSPACAQFVGVQYGPRAFSTAPTGTQALDIKYDRMSIGLGVDGTLLTGIKNESNALYLSYTRYFSLWGKSASFLVALPYVDIASSVSTTCCGSFPALSTSGLSDPFLQFNVPLVGGEAMSPQEFFTTEPGLNVTLHTGLRPPVGEYDSSSPLNSGANRFVFRIGLPVSHTWGTPTKQTSLEFFPTIYFFEDNDDPFGAGRVAQDLAFQMEFHVTHDFSPKFVAAWNIMHVTGGETESDGVPGKNSLNYTGTSVSLGVRLSKFLSGSVSYGIPLKTKHASRDGSQMRVGLTYVF
jgi:hypothetical protein